MTTTEPNCKVCADTGRARLDPQWETTDTHYIDCPACDLGKALSNCSVEETKLGKIKVNNKYLVQALRDDRNGVCSQTQYYSTYERAEGVANTQATNATHVKAGKAFVVFKAIKVVAVAELPIISYEVADDDD